MASAASVVTDMGAPRRYVLGGEAGVLQRARMLLADLRGRGVYQGMSGEPRCIFIHIPKTAGSSIASTLFGSASRHVPYFEYRNANPWKFARYMKFAFVRNPWDRLVSTYFFLRRGGMNEADRKWAEENVAPFPDFATFVSEWLTEANVWSWVHFLPQHYFVCDEAHVLQMDFLGRFETLERDFGVIADRLGKHMTLPKVNPSNHAQYRDYYDARLRERVARVYQKDIELFGYSF